MSNATWTRTGGTFGGAEHNVGRRRTTSMTRAAAMRALGPVVYAARLADGTIKIGWTRHFDKRMAWLKGYRRQDVELLAFRVGTYDDEQAVHAGLIGHRVEGYREYYHPTPEVLAVVIDMRESLNMPHVAA